LKALVDLTDRAAREGLNRGALRAFFTIMERRGVRDAEARVLLGGDSYGRY